MHAFCFSPFTIDFFCFFAFAAGFLFCLAFCGGNHSRRSRTVPVYFRELIPGVTTAPMVISSASTRMCFMFTRFCSPLHDLSIHWTKTSFFLQGISTPPINCRFKRFHTSVSHCIISHLQVRATHVYTCVRASEGGATFNHHSNSTRYFIPSICYVTHE